MDGIVMCSTAHYYYYYNVFGTKAAKCLSARRKIDVLASHEFNLLAGTVCELWVWACEPTAEHLRMDIVAVAAPSNGESFALENRLTCDSNKTTKGIVAFRLILLSIFFFLAIFALRRRARLSVTLYRHNCLAIAIWHTARHLYSLIRPFLEHKFHVTRVIFMRTSAAIHITSIRCVRPE